MSPTTAARPFALPSAGRWIGAALVLGALALVVLAFTAGIAQRKETLAASLGIGGAILLGGALVIRAPGLLAALNVTVFGKVTRACAFVVAAWGLLLAASVATYSSSGWDECAYLLSGLALRGYPTPYAAGRAPVTHAIAALFADAPQFAAATLLLLLLGLLGFWSFRRWGWAAGVLPLALLAPQNIFVESLVGLVSELPAALLLLAAFFLLARERFFAAGALFALAGLARWNLAVIPLAVAGCVAWRFGLKPTLRLAGGGALVAALFFGLSAAFVEHPLRAIVENNLRPAIAWAEEGAPRPTVASRAWFYFSHAFFLTPPALLAIGAALAALPRAARERADAWCVRVAMPVGLTAYAVTMLFIGGHFARFMAPIVPCAMFILADFLLRLSPRATPAAEPRFSFAVALACIAAAWGIWPGSAVSTAKVKAEHRAVFLPDFAAAVATHVPADAWICAPVVAPLSDSNGLPAMVELRRHVVFPEASRGPNGDLRPAADHAEAVRALLRAEFRGDFLIIPAEQRRLLPPESILAADARWALCLSPAR